MKSTALFAVCVVLIIHSVLGNAHGGLLEGDQGRKFAMVPVADSPVAVAPDELTAGIFAATTTGLVAINLQTLEATTLTSEFTCGVAVNHNLKKIYWSETLNNNRIIRSNYNGSDKEIIVPPTGGNVFALAVHEPSGYVYYSPRASNQITACNAIGENCSVVVSSSSLANDVWSITFDSANNVMYWSNYENVRTSLIRANLDGSSVTRIASFFTTSTVIITFAQTPVDTLYWTHISDDTIGTIQVDGYNKRTLVALEGKPGPVGIQVDAQKIYFGNYGSKTIQSVDRDSGEGLTTLLNSTGRIYHLALH